MRNICFTVLALFCNHIYAQSAKDTVISISEIVINENRFSTPVSKQARNIYVIDKATITKLPGRSLQEVLQYANGVDIRQRGPFGSQADISIDGGSFEQTLVLLNGVKIIDTQTAHNMLNLPIPAELIERIEVIRGPAARIYGINSLTGAINIITKRPADTGFLISTYAGSNFEKDTEGTRKTFYARGIQLGAAISKEKHQHSLFGSQDKSNGHRFNTQFRNNKVFYQGNAQINDRNEISGSFGYIDNEFGANGFYAAPGDRNATELVQTTLASVESRHFLSDRWVLTPRLSYRYNDDDYRYLGNQNLSTGRSRHFSHSAAIEINTSYTLPTGELGFGVEARRENINSTSIGRRQRENIGVYAQYRTRFLAKTELNAGAYLNYNSQYGWQVYPGLDASYSLTNKLRLVGSIGTGQRLPSFTDLYLDQRPGNIGNADVRPEDAFQSELGFKLLDGNFNLSSSYFYRNINRFIDWTRTTSSEPWQSNNLGHLVTRGLNIRSHYSPAISHRAGLNFSLAYSYLDSEFGGFSQELQSKYLIASLKHQINHTADLSYKGLSVLLATRFNERVSGPSYWINDIRISQSVNKLTFLLDAQNVFNTTYYEIGAIPLPARWLSFGVKLTTL